MITDSLKMGGAILVLVCSIAAGMPTVAADPTNTSSTSAPAIPPIVKGDVLNIEGEFYFVKDLTGHEIRLHVSKDTKTDDRVKVGDKIEARVTPDGHVSSLTVQLPPSGTTPVGSK